MARQPTRSHGRGQGTGRTGGTHGDPRGTHSLPPVQLVRIEDARVLDFLQQQGFTLREVLLDSGSSLGQTIGSRGLPITLFFDAKGRQVDAHFGSLNAAALESRLRPLRPSP